MELITWGLAIVINCINVTLPSKPHTSYRIRFQNLKSKNKYKIQILSLKELPGLNSNNNKMKWPITI